MVGKVAACILSFLVSLIFPSTISLSDAPPLLELPEERCVSYLKERQWKILNPDTPKQGSIHGFASDCPERCAVWMANHIYLLYGTKTIVCFQIELTNDSRLFFLDNQLGIFEDRGDFVLLINLDTFQTSLYVMQIENGNSYQYGLRNRFVKLVSNPSKGKDGYYVRNKLIWIDFLSTRYDSLILRSGGEEIVLYETNRRIIYFSFFVLMNGIILVILVCVMRWKRKIKKLYS